MIADLELARLCAATYGRPADIARGAAHVVLTETQGVSIAAFRGSQSVADWLADLDDAPMIESALGPCPRGFLMAVQGVANELIERLDAKPVILTGHSLGGAEALIFGAMLSERGVPPVKITTFGAPRCGRAMLARLVGNLAGADYRHRDDPVPLIPPGYQHPRPLVQLVAPRLELDVIADHFIENYLMELSQAA